MSIQKKITIDTIKQLIDINGDSTNFKAELTVAAPNGDEFQLVVVDQNTLDGEEELKYQNVKGSLSVSITSDKNLHQNYYLVLKADRPIPVEIKIDFEELPAQELDYKPKVYDPPAEFKKDEFSPKGGSADPPKNQNVSKTGGINWKLILIAAVVIIGGYFLYKFYRESPAKKSPAEEGTAAPKSPSKSPSKSPQIESPQMEIPRMEIPRMERENAMKPPGRFTFGRVPAASKYY